MTVLLIAEYDVREPQAHQRKRLMITSSLLDDLIIAAMSNNEGWTFYQVTQYFNDTPEISTQKIKNSLNRLLKGKKIRTEMPCDQVYYFINS